MEERQVPLDLAVLLVRRGRDLQLVLLVFGHREHAQVAEERAVRDGAAPLAVHRDGRRVDRGRRVVADAGHQTIAVVHQREGAVRDVGLERALRVGAARVASEQQPLPIDRAVEALAKAGYAAHLDPTGSTERGKVDAFNLAYSDLLRLLQRAFGGNPAAIGAAVTAMQNLRPVAQDLVATTDPPPRGSHVSFELVIGEQRHKIEGEVCWVRDERMAAIRKCVETLPERQRVAVIMHKYHELDYREIARVLKMSESATKSLLFRAYETLRVALKDFV